MKLTHINRQVHVSPCNVITSIWYKISLHTTLFAGANYIKSKPKDWKKVPDCLKCLHKRIGVIGTASSKSLQLLQDPIRQDVSLVLKWLYMYVCVRACLRLKEAQSIDCKPRTNNAVDIFILELGQLLPAFGNASIYLCIRVCNVCVFVCVCGIVEWVRRGWGRVIVGVNPSLWLLQISLQG